MSVQVDNTARDHSTVGLQIGVVHGDATFYQSNDVSAIGKFQTGKNYLNGNVPRRARELIEAAYHEGHRTVEVGYHWALAILSGRSLDHLDEEDLGQLETALGLAAGAEDDGYGKALGVVARFVRVAFPQDGGGEPDEAGLIATLDAYRGLPDARREEVRRHLDRVLTGALQDHVEAVDAAEVRRNRMAADRRERAPWFFMAVPAEPRPRALAVAGSLGPAWCAAVTGTVLLLTGLGLAVCLLVWLDPVTLPLVLPVLAVGGGAAGYYGVRRRWLACQRRAARSRFAVGRLRPRRVPPTPAVLAFVGRLRAMIDESFRLHRPAELTEARWFQETRGIRAVVLDDLIAQYGWALGPDAPLDIEWLVTWHALDTAARWQARTLYEYRDRLRTPAWFHAVFWVAVGALVVGVLEAIVGSAMTSVLGGLAVTFLLAVGIPLAYLGGGAILVEGWRVDEEVLARDRQLVVEQEAYLAWEREYWTKRPPDDVMARWLDYDKAFIKAAALARYRLHNREVIGHFTLTEKLPGCRSARAIFGPPRYSAYRIRLFILTEGGVREFTTGLDFATGALFSEDRNAFRYDAITSVRVCEGAAPPASVSSRSLDLAFNNGGRRVVTIENFDDGLFDGARENVEFLSELAEDSSGITEALRILEAMAAEGGKWIERERRRRDRRLKEHREKRYGDASLEGVAPRLRLSS